MNTLRNRLAELERQRGASATAGETAGAKRDRHLGYLRDAFGADIDLAEAMGNDAAPHNG